MSNGVASRLDIHQKSHQRFAKKRPGRSPGIELMFDTQPANPQTKKNKNLWFNSRKRAGERHIDLSGLDTHGKI